MIKLNKITKTFQKGTIQAICPLDLEVNKGEIIGILGENGAGKTTLLKIIATLLKPDTGSITICGYNAKTQSSAVRLKTGLLLGSETGLYDRLTAYENIIYFADLFGIKRKAAEERLKHLGNLFQMKQYMHRKAGTFSMGMKQKTALSRVLVHNPEIILLDEPSTGLDMLSTKIMHEFILRCSEEGRTILFSSHRIEEITKLCHRVCVLHKGKLVSEKNINTQDKMGTSNLEQEYLSIISQGQS